LVDADSAPFFVVWDDDLLEMLVEVLEKERQAAVARRPIEPSSVSPQLNGLFCCFTFEILILSLSLLFSWSLTSFTNVFHVDISFLG
jgi:hypothetical protein